MGDDRKLIDDVRRAAHSLTGGASDYDALLACVAPPTVEELPETYPAGV